MNKTHFSFSADNWKASTEVPHLPVSSSHQLGSYQSDESNFVNLRMISEYRLASLVVESQTFPSYHPKTHSGKDSMFPNRLVPHRLNTASDMTAECLRDPIPFPILEAPS